ncbi:MAG: universal stress protein [Verrucomicrobia bacterium]|nr:universal stress protein [Verrucomicrobiota bacterium]
MKPNPKPRGGAAAKSKARVVVTDRAGHRVASAPVSELAPVRFHIRQILVPMDFSEHSRKSLQYAVPFAQQFGATLVLLHVIEPMVFPGEFAYAPMQPQDMDEQRMDQARQRLQAAADELGTGVPVVPEVRLGRAWKEIAETAKSREVDLLIISTHGYTGLKYALLGSVAEKIVRHAPCPVLVVRTEEHDFV